MNFLKTRLLPILFLLTLAIHALDSWLQVFPEPKLNERRVPTPKPELDISFLDPYPSDYEAYYNDHFKWRNFLIRINSLLNYYTFKKSSLPEKVLTGKEGWLFKAGHQLDIYRGKFRFTNKQLRELEQELLYRKKAVEDRGGKYYLITIPLKHSIYPEYLPNAIKKVNPETPTQQLLNHLGQHTDLRFLDLTAPLIQAKGQGKYPLYYLTDHHWTDYAGLLATQQILDFLRIDFPELGRPELADFEISWTEYNGLTLAQMLGIDQELKEKVPIVSNKKQNIVRDSTRNYPPPPDFEFPQDYVVANYTGRTKLPTLFVTRESFSNNLIPFLSEYFESGFYVFDKWEHKLNLDLYEKEGGDIYIQLIWEGLLSSLLKEPPAGAGW